MSRTNTRGNTYRRAAGRAGLLTALAMVIGVATAPLASAQENVACPQTPEATPINATLSIGSLRARSSSPATDPSPTAGVPVNLTLSSTDGPIDYYCNQHGDPATNPPGQWNYKTASSTQHRYDTPGDYTVKRVAFDDPGPPTPASRSNIVELVVDVNSPPTASFNVSNDRPLVGQEVTFTSRSSDADGSVEHAWDLDGDHEFDDATGKTVVRAYERAGEYEVSVRATDDRGSRRDSYAATITVADPARPPAGNVAGGSLTVGPAPATPTGPNVDDLLTDARPCSAVTRGTTGSDRMTGTRASDRLLGLSGHDVLSGLAGIDCLVGGAGQDRLSGGNGSDRLTGGSGSDRLIGGAGADVLSGGSGSNRLYGGSGGDTLDAVNGRRDMVSCGSGRDSARVDRVDIVRGCERLRRGRA